MTPDHNVLTERGWRCASSSEGLHRAGFWLPDGSEVSGGKWATLCVGLPVQLRDGSIAGSRRRGKVCAAWRASVMWLQSWGRQQVAQYVKTSGVLGMAVHAGSMPLTDAPSMAQLWRSRYHGMPSVGTFLRRVLGRHGADVSRGADTGPQRQQRRLYPDELSLGNFEGASAEPQGVATSRHDQSVQVDWRFQIDAPVSLAPEPVFDLRNSGPNSRFVVRGSNGPFIVHNCVENVTQALARIIIGEQMLRISKKYRAVLTVHDSIVCCVPDDEAQACKAYVEDCMRWVPDWATGLPVDCEAGTGKNYGDCDG